MGSSARLARVIVKDQEHRPAGGMGPRVELARPAVTMGMRADSVRPGDAVSVTFHPLRNGFARRSIIPAVLPAGRRSSANARDENE